MAKLDAPEPVNLVRSIFFCNIFNFLLSASKACLIPFLAIYLKKLGLSATQTGIIIGAKTLVGLVFAPLWSKCAVRCGRRRCVLMFSLFVMAATYLSLTAVPSMDQYAFAAECAKPNNNYNVSHLADGLPSQVETTVKPALTSKPVNQSASASNIVPTTTAISKVSNTESKENKTGAKPGVTLITAKLSSVVTTTTSATTRTKQPLPTVKPTIIKPTVPYNSKIEEVLKNLLIAVGMPEKQLSGLSQEELEELVNELLTTPTGQKLIADAIDIMSPEDKETLAGLNSRRKRDVDERETDTDRENSDQESESTWSMVKTSFLKQFKDFLNHIKDTQHQMFIVVLVILMVGESLCCPIEKIADDGWYEFLESIDDLEKYGMHRIWSTFAYILIPFLVTLIIDNTNCLFGLSIHPFMLHFYLFSAFLGLTFLLAFCYPMVTTEKYKYATKVVKGIKVVCFNLRSLMFVVTLLITGMVYASYFNFLFWMLIDMGSKEFPLGVCLTVAALAEIPMLLFNEKLIRKINNGGVVCLSVLFLSARCLYYSYLPTPWAVLPAELTHAFTHTALWWAILSSQSYNTSAALSRSIRSILSTIYFGFGFAFGSFVSGVVYDVYGSAILFQAGAVLSIAWFPFLAIGMRCCTEKDRSHVKYTRLLNSDDASDSDSMEDDWLEQALKDR